MRKGYLKKAMFLALATVMCAGLAGCGKKVKTTTEDPKTAKQNVFSYANYEIDFPSNGQDTYFDISGIDSYGDTTFAIASTYDYNTGDNINYLVDIETETGKTSTVLIEKPDLTGLSEHPDTEDYYEYLYYGSFKAVSGMIVGTCNFSSSYYDESGNYVGNDKSLLCAWNTDGKYIWSADISEEMKADYLNLSNGFVANDNYYVIANGNTSDGKEIKAILGIDKNGKVVSKNDIAANTNLNTIFPLRDGRFVAFYYDDQYMQKAAFYDLNSGNLGEEAVVPATLFTGGYTKIQPGFDSDFIYSSNQGIYKFNIGDTESTKLFDPINSDLNGYNVDDFVFLDKDHFIGAYSNIDSYNSEVALFTYVDPSTIPDKKIISMAVYYLGSDVRKRVVDFNKTSDTYRIVVEDYSQYASQDDWMAGYTKLNNDILAGKVPAILFMDPNAGIDYESFAKKGLLADIDSLIQKDPELSQYSYLQNVFDAYAISGKHYLVVPTFNYNTFMISSKMAGGKTQLTVDEFIELCKNAPAGSMPYEYTTKAQFLNQVMNYDGCEFIDPATKKCQFDSPEFVKLIEYAATLPEEANYDDDFYTDYYDNFRSGKIIFSQLYLSDVNTYQTQKYNMYYGDGTIIGFPTKENQPGTINNAGNTFALTNGSNIDGAWEFARFYLTPEYQDALDYSIPVLESSFDNWLAKGMERPYWEDENGIKNYYDNTYYVDGVEKIIPVMTQEDIDYLRNVITSCSKRGYNNEQIMSIIEEECSACFAGQKSASEVCAIIQSRVQLYINENN